MFKYLRNDIYENLFVKSVGLNLLSCVDQACQTEGPPRAAWVTFVLSWGPHTTINW
jgi:hypothetical protein